jgi:hypothetical protein
VRALRTPSREIRLAAALWIAWAVIVWNVVFDHAIVVAGRAYVHAASVAAQRGGPFARMDDWMRPAVVRGVWMASAAAATILVAGLVGIRAAARAR